MIGSERVNSRRIMRGKRCRSQAGATREYIMPARADRLPRGFDLGQGGQLRKSHQQMIPVLELPCCVISIGVVKEGSLRCEIQALRSGYYAPWKKDGKGN